MFEDFLSVASMAFLSVASMASSDASSREFCCCKCVLCAEIVSVKRRRLISKSPADREFVSLVTTEDLDGNVYHWHRECLETSDGQKFNKILTEFDPPAECLN